MGVRKPLLVLAGVLAAWLSAPVVAQSPQSPVVKVVGDRHQLALKADGTVVGWGQWRQAQLGPVTAIGVTTLFTDRPIPIALPGKAIDVAAGDATSYALLDDGTVWAWGDGRGGALGTGPGPPLPLLATSTPSMEYRGAERPVKVGLEGVTAIDAASRVAVAILKDGTVVQWPRARAAGAEPQLRPVVVPGLANVAQVSVGAGHVLARTTDGRVRAWGGNLYRAVGVEAAEPYIYDPVDVPGLTDVAAVATCNDASLVLKRDGTVWVWGSNGQGAFGNGQRASHPSVGTVSTPQQVPGITNAVALAAASTGRSVFVILKDGTLRAWGNTDFGQLGAGVSATFQLSPVTPKIASVKAVFAVGNNSFAVKTDGSFWGWGNGDTGRWPFQAVTKVPTPLTLP